MEKAINKDLHDFKQFMKEREEASQAFLNGDIGPLDRISTHVSPATIFGPTGDSIEGADKVNAANAKAAKHFESGSKSTFEVLHMAVSEDIAYWVGLQRATARMRGKKEAVPFNLRVTEVFRREGGEWKLVHRHADPLAAESEDKKQ